MIAQAFYNDRRAQGCMRRAPSSLMVSPLSRGFSTMAWASWAYSSGLPSRWGNGMLLAKKTRTFSGSAASSGVSKRPGAIVTTRIPEKLKIRDDSVIICDCFGIQTRHPSHITSTLLFIVKKKKIYIRNF